MDQKYFSYPKRTDIVSDKQYYTDGEVELPSSLWQTPDGEAYPALDKDGIKAYFIDSVSDTKVFVYVGLPKNASSENKVPGMVLVHGGGGTAFADWVLLWTSRGYAAIAMDTDGNMPNERSNMDNNEHDISVKPHGPANTAFGDSNKPIVDQWAYHAVASVIASHSFLRSFECVDQNKIGMTGISYGGFLSTATPAYDDRFMFSAPVYGCVSLDGTLDNWGRNLKNYPRAVEIWDDIEVLETVKTPMFFINGSNDDFFTINATTRCAEKASYGSMCIKYHYPHGHSVGADIDEIFAYADWILKDKTGLVHIKKTFTKDSSEITLDLPKDTTVSKVHLYYTPNSELSKNTAWLELDQSEGIDRNILSIEIPVSANHVYVNIVDSNNLEISTGVVSVK